MNIVEHANDFCINYLNCIKKASKDLWITQSQALCIQSIPYDGISQTDLSKKLFLDLSTLSRNLDKLIKLNLIEKTIAPLDKRSYKIYLTKRGKTLYQDLNNKINFYFQDIYSELGFKKVDDLVDILSAINWQFEILNNE